MIELPTNEQVNAPVAGEPEPARALVFRCGQLGDMIMSLPAMWAVRRHWPRASLTLLCDVHPGRLHVLGSDILGRTGLFDGIEHYEVTADGQAGLRMLASRVRLLWRLRTHRYDALIYLAPSIRKPKQVRRDVAFFRAAGIRRLYGVGHFPPVPIKRSGQPFSQDQSEADLLLARLAADGIEVPGRGQGSLDLRLGAAEAAEVSQWRSSLTGDGGRVWLGVGPGSKMPAKRWPLERFGAAIAALIERYDIWPVIFGGPEDRADGERLVTQWGRGHNAAGALSARASAMALKNCALYLGNDTGTMHLAASAGLPCVALFSARDWPGAWYPYGVRRRVFRTAPPCEGCYLVQCNERNNACLTEITVDQVIAGCEEMLREISKAAAELVARAG